MLWAFDALLLLVFAGVGASVQRKAKVRGGWSRIERLVGVAVFFGAAAYLEFVGNFRTSSFIGSLGTLSLIPGLVLKAKIEAVPRVSSRERAAE